MNSILFAFFSILCWGDYVISQEGVMEVDRLGHLCDLTKCSKMTHIENPKPLNISLSSSMIKATIYSFPLNTKMHIVTKEFRWRNCAPSATAYSDKEGGSRLEVTLSEMKKIVHSGKCSIGKICSADNCMHQDNLYCGRTEGFTLEENTGYTVDMACNSRYAFLWTCNQDFSCQKTITVNPIFIGFRNKRPIPFIKNPINQESIDITNEFYSHKDGVSYYVEPILSEATKEDVNVRCYRDSMDSICRIEDGENSGMTFRKEREIVLKENSAIIFDNAHDIDPTFKDYKASSMHDIKSIFEVLQYVSMQSETNIVKLAHEVRLMSIALVKVINSLGKVDDSLIGNIMDKSSKTIWISPDVFKQCACAVKTKWDWDSLVAGASPCQDSSIPFQKVSKGYVTREDSQERAKKWISDNLNSACSINNNTVDRKRFDFEAFEMEYDHIFLPTLTGTADDWSGMTWITGMINKEIYDSGKLSDPATTGGYFSSFSGLGFLDVIISNISWISLVVALLALLRR